MKEEKYCVYKHIFPDGRCYIGMTKNLKKRWEGNGCSYKKSAIYHLIKEFGWDNIKHEVLFKDLTIEQASKIEDNLILEAKNIGISLNISRGGVGGSHHAWNKGIPLSDEQKTKLSKANKGHVVSNETRQKISNGLMGRVVTEETRAKIGKKNSRPHTKEHISKFRESCRWRFIPVKVYLKGEFIGEYENLYLAIKELGLHKGNAYRALSSKTHVCNGYTIIKQ